MTTAPIPRACTRCGYDMSGLASVCPECGCPSEMYTDRARAVAVAANEWAKKTARGVDSLVPVRRFHFRLAIRPVHLALGIVQGPEGVARHVLGLCGAVNSELTAALLGLCPSVVCRNRVPDATLAFSPRAKLLAEVIAPGIAHGAGHAWIGTEHLLLAVLKRGPGDLVRCFAEHNATFERVFETVRRNHATQPLADT